MPAASQLECKDSGLVLGHQCSQMVLLLFEGWVKITRQPEHCIVNELKTGLRYLKDRFYAGDYNIRISVNKPNLIHQIHDFSKINGSVTLPVNCAAIRYEKRTNDIRRIVHRLPYIQHTD